MTAYSALLTAPDFNEGEISRCAACRTGKARLRIKQAPTWARAGRAGGLQPSRQCDTQPSDRAHPRGIAMGTHIGFKPYTPRGICRSATGKRGRQLMSRLKTLVKKPSRGCSRPNNHSMGREANLPQPCVRIFIRSQSPMAVVGPPLEPLLSHAKIAIGIVKDEPFMT